jgi:hypothetical protein
MQRISMEDKSAKQGPGWEEKGGYGAGDKTVDQLQPPPASIMKKPEKS